MLAAVLQGKLSREQENMEDILTSNVFGALQYTAPSAGLIPFLSMASTAKGATLDFLTKEGECEVDYEFWPWWESTETNGCEPDVVLTIRGNFENYKIVIESKYRSAKSLEVDFGYIHPTDQLAREWDNLIVRRGKWTPILIYLTAHISEPIEEINASIEEYTTKRPTSETPRIYWLSWSYLYSLFHKSNSPSLRDLAMLVDRLNLRFFHGFGGVEHYPDLHWRFTSGSKQEIADNRFNWATSPKSIGISWRFLS